MLGMRAELSFPAIRGIQARREYYAAMFPLKLIPKLILFNEDEAALTPELRAQRTLNRQRIPEMARYLTDNRDSYVFSAITVSIDGDVNFQSLGEKGNLNNIGTLHVPAEANFIVNDGQHRRAAIEEALKDNHDLADEIIAVVFFIYRGLKRCQQMFADLNRYAIRPAKSLGVLFDHRDERAELARLVVLQSDLFRNLVEKERSSLSHRSRKLFTLSAIYQANTHLLEGFKFDDIKEAAAPVIEFWEEVALQIPEWTMARDSKILASEIRSDFIHTQGVVLSALGKVGNTLLHRHSKNWKNKLKPLARINWARSNTRQWEGRAMVAGRIARTNQNITLTANAIKKALKLKLSPEEQRIENAFSRGGNG